MSLIIDATKAAERERDKKSAGGGTPAPLLIPLRSRPQPEFSWQRAAMLGIGGAILLGAGWVALAKFGDTRRQPMALVSPPLIGDVAVVPMTADSVADRADTAAAVPAPASGGTSSETVARAPSRPVRQVAAGSAVATSGETGGAATPQGDAAARAADSGSSGRLRIAVDSREASISQIFAAGVAAHRAGNFADAQRSYERVLGIDRNHVDALNNIGVLFSETREFARAETMLRRAIALDPANAGAWNNLGAALAQQGQSGDAIAAFQHALSIEPRHVNARLSLAQQFLTIGSTTESRKLLEDVLSTNPSVPEAYYTMGQVLELEQDVAGAIRAYTAFVRLAPGRLQQHAQAVQQRIDALSARLR